MSELKAPSGKEIDKLIEEYSHRQKLAAGASLEAKELAVKADELKVQLVDLVQLHGADHTEKSKRLRGLRHFATVTIGTLVQSDDDAIDRFRGYLAENAIEDVSKFFSERVTYQLVKGPSEVLRTLDLPGKVRKKMESLVALCFRVTTKAPSLKVDVAEAAS